MPGWGRRLRIMIDWTFALLFRPDIVKISLASERTLLAHNVASGAILRGQAGRRRGTPDVPERSNSEATARAGG